MKRVKAHSNVRQDDIFFKIILKCLPEIRQYRQYRENLDMIKVC